MKRNRVGPDVQLIRDEPMKERLMQILKNMVAVTWCHRMAYAGLAAAYGAGCAGVLDKDLVNQIVTGLYVALVLQHGD